MIRRPWTIHIKYLTKLRGMNGEHVIKHATDLDMLKDYGSMQWHLITLSDV